MIISPGGRKKGEALQAQELERLVKERTVKYEVMLDSTPSGLLGVNQGGEIVLVNAALQEMFGYSREELLRQPLDLLMPDNKVKAHRQHMINFFKSPRPLEMGEGMDLQGRRKGGKLFPIEAILRPVEGDSEVAALASIVDITRRKVAERELKRSNEELERFAYLASHDLKEPLRTVRNFSEFLIVDVKKGDEKRVEEDVRFIRDACSRMESLVDGLLQLSRAGAAQIDIAPCDLGKVVEGVEFVLATAIHESRVILNIETPLPTVQGDSTQLSMVFQNLIQNAIKFQQPESQPIINISSKSNHDETLVDIFVEDNGIGIKEEHQRSIFGVFKKLHASNVYQGTGIGLAIAEKIVKRHFGEISVRSTPGEGSTFRVSLPLCQFE